MKSEVIFGPLNFFKLRYIKGGVRGNNNIGIKKCTTIFLWVLNLEQVGGRRRFFQNLTTGMIFSKMVSNLSVLEGIFETKFQGRFFFGPKNFKWVSFVKLKVSSIFCENGGKSNLKKLH